jgi:quinol monooxygenase YgiN
MSYTFFQIIVDSGTLLGIARDTIYYHPNTYSMDKNTLYFLKITGFINKSKHQEFQQTVQFIFNHLSAACLNRNLALDINTPNLFHFYSMWQSEDSLLAFKSSHEYELLKGAFKTLGLYEETMAGKKAELQLFELDYLDT